MIERSVFSVPLRIESLLELHVATTTEREFCASDIVQYSRAVGTFTDREFIRATYKHYYGARVLCFRNNKLLRIESFVLSELISQMAENFVFRYYSERFGYKYILIYIYIYTQKL